MASTKHQILTFFGGWFLSAVIFFLLILSLLSREHGPDFFSAVFDGLLTFIAIVTGLYAIRSFWYTDEKDKTERAISYIEKLNETQTLKDIGFVLKNFHEEKKQENPLWLEMDRALKANNNKIKELSERFDDEIAFRLVTVLSLLESIGLLHKYKKINLKMIYDNFALQMEDLWHVIEPYIRAQQLERGIVVWENLVFLKEEFDRYKNK